MSVCSSIDGKPRIPCCDNNISMVALRKKLVEVNIWIFSIVKEEQPLFFPGSEPLYSCLGSVTNLLFYGYIFKACVHCSLSTTVDETGAWKPKIYQFDVLT